MDQQRCSTEDANSCSTQSEVCVSESHDSFKGIDNEITTASKTQSICCSKSTISNCHNVNKISGFDKSLEADRSKTVVQESLRLNSGSADHPGITLPATTLLMGASQSLGRVKICHCRRVHLGHVTCIVGPVNVTRVLRKNNISQQIFVSTADGTDSEKTDADVQLVRRLEWLAQPPKEPPMPLNGPVDTVVICHTATDSATTLGKNTLIVRRLQMFHIEGRGWSDIAYNFLVGMDGNVFEGRGWSLQGQHTEGHNSNSLSIAMVGFFNQQTPTAVAMEALQRLLSAGERAGRLTPDYRVVAHCQLENTGCPGAALFQLLNGVRTVLPEEN